MRNPLFLCLILLNLYNKSMLFSIILCIVIQLLYIARITLRFFKDDVPKEVISGISGTVLLMIILSVAAFFLNFGYLKIKKRSPKHSVGIVFAIVAFGLCLFYYITVFIFRMADRSIAFIG